MCWLMFQVKRLMLLKTQMWHHVQLYSILLLSLFCNEHIFNIIKRELSGCRKVHCLESYWRISHLVSAHVSDNLWAKQHCVSQCMFLLSHIILCISTPMLIFINILNGFFSTRNCYIAAGIYAVTFLLSAHQKWVNSRSGDMQQKL